MIVTATESPAIASPACASKLGGSTGYQHPAAGRWPLGRAAGLILVLAALVSLVACAEEPLPQRRLAVGDCLHRVDLDQLPQALERCDRVVAAFPKEPQPLNERFLLHSLLGQEEAACRDIRKAQQLASRLPAARLDRMLRQDLRLRLASCKD